MWVLFGGQSLAHCRALVAIVMGIVVVWRWEVLPRGLLLREVGAAGGHLAAFAFVLDEVGGLCPGHVRAGHVPGGLGAKRLGRGPWLTADGPGLAFVFGACPGVQLGG